jgi:hypothetical protein
MTERRFFDRLRMSGGLRFFAALRMTGGKVQDDTMRRAQNDRKGKVFPHNNG